MDILNLSKAYDTLKVNFDQEVCFIQIHRPEAKNTINDSLIAEFIEVLDLYEQSAKIIVIEGLPDVFCFGADFKQIQTVFDAGPTSDNVPNPELMYNLWMRLAFGPYITIAHVRGVANAGGIGFVAACDIVICEEKTTFSLSELLFGLMPACVLPFLVRRIGAHKANYMTVMTEPVSATDAVAWGLVDDCTENTQNLLRKKLLRLRRLSKNGIARYKRYMSNLDDILVRSREKALAANIEVFSDRDNLEKIARYVNTGQFPWEGD